MIWLIVIGISIISGVLYRLGGWSKGNRLFRIVGCPVAFVATCLCLGLFRGFWGSAGAYFLFFGLSCGAVSAYWGQDEKPFGYLAHGLGLSLAALPIAVLTEHYIGLGILCIAKTGLMSLWSEYTSQDTIEEIGRGIISNITLPLLLIG